MVKFVWPAILIIAIGGIPAAAALVIPVWCQSWNSRMSFSIPARLSAARLSEP